MKEPYYADGVEKVVFSEGMVRMDLFCYGERPGDVPGSGMASSPHEVTAQLVMPPAGFLRALETMEELVERMERAGILVRHPGAGMPGADSGQREDRGAGAGTEAGIGGEVCRDGDPGQGDGRSPNFR